MTPEQFEKLTEKLDLINYSLCKIKEQAEYQTDFLERADRRATEALEN